MSQNQSPRPKTRPHVPKPDPTFKTTLHIPKPALASPNQPMPTPPTRTENRSVMPTSTQQGDIALPAVPPPPYLALRDMVLSPGHIQRSALPPTTASVIAEGTCGDTDGLGQGAAVFSIRRALTHRVGQSNRFAGFWHKETHPSFFPTGIERSFLSPSCWQPVPTAAGGEGVARGGGITPPGPDPTA